MVKNRIIDLNSQIQCLNCITMAIMGISMDNETKNNLVDQVFLTVDILKKEVEELSISDSETPKRMFSEKMKAPEPKCEKCRTGKHFSCKEPQIKA